MFNYLLAIVAGLLTVSLSRTLLALSRNVELAKASGLPYRVSFISGIPGYLWIATHNLFLGPLAKFAPSRKWLWPKLIHIHRSWYYPQEMREALGELYLIVSPSQIFMSSSNPQVNFQLTSRRLDFVKPVELYAIVDIFGSSILTTEGAEWKRHRKIVAPAFSEKSNALVWKESLGQGLGMLRAFKRMKGNEEGEMKVEDMANFTATMALHVISAAGFGVRQLWDGEDEKVLGSTVVPGFNITKLIGSHTLTFKDALNTLLHGIIWLAIFPVALLKKSPFELHKKLLRAYSECSDYFKELSEYKLKLIEKGETTEKGVMDIMGPLVLASERTPENSKGLYLTKQEVISNSWITLFAGHETSANILHYCFLFLAIELEKQAQLQSDIDSIVGSRPSSKWTYETDLNKLWHSMVGTTINETLRLMPPVIDIPKVVRDVPQLLTFDGKTVMVPKDTIIHISAVGVQRNPKYWPHEASKLTGESHDLDDWVPERWLSYSAKTSDLKLQKEDDEEGATEEEFKEKTTSFENGTNNPNPLYTPIKGSFIPFSEGARACPGKRFAQVELTAVLAVVFKEYSLELDINEWASDEDIKLMGKERKKEVYEKGKDKARKLIFASESEIFLQMRGKYPVRFVKRGSERFLGVFEG